MSETGQALRQAAAGARPRRDSARFRTPPRIRGMPENDQPSLYERMGGAETFATITRVFYEGVATDPLLKPMYPEEDLGPAEERLRWFLAQYWGGPSTFSENRGHPRLRMRHMPFQVTPEARDRWLHHMMRGVDAAGLEPELDALMRDYLQRAAHSLVNTEPPVPFGAALPGN